MQNNIRTRDIVVIGLMLFALFFGAGNLVFPAMLGQSAGTNSVLANLGFLTTGVGLPLLAVLAFSFSGKQDLLSLSNRVHPWFGVIYTTILYLTIGPLFAMPRTGSVSYEIAIKPYVQDDQNALILLTFTALFFLVTLVFSLSPSKMIDIVGKWLTPLLILFILIMAIVALVNPMGTSQAPIEKYETNAYFLGFQEGYLTMDTLAAFVFGIIVINALKEKGATSKKQLLIVGTKAALISSVILALIYSLLTYIGATSVEKYGLLDNGGNVLSSVANHYFGTYGGIILGVIVLLACLTTSIGLTTSCSSYLAKLYPKISYKAYAVILTIISMLLANVGLTELIQISVPVLTIIYPLAIVLIFLTLLHHVFKEKVYVYRLSLIFTFAVSIIEGLSSSKLDSSIINTIYLFYNKYLPLFSVGLGWLIPAIVGGLLGLLFKAKVKETD